MSLSLKTVLSLLLVLSAQGLQNCFGILLRQLSCLLAAVVSSGDVMLNIEDLCFIPYHSFRLLGGWVAGKIEIKANTAQALFKLELLKLPFSIFSLSFWILDHKTKVF